jgi:D-beta-D-heptose 7-phosphate kinase/D-beta-D-heptose 1-phosphate adenosyltransferase
MKILVIGESCEDVFRYGAVERIEPSAFCPVFEFVYETRNGGMALNVLNNLKSLGADTSLKTNENWKEIQKIRYVEIKSNHLLLRADFNDKNYTKCDVKNIKFDNYDAIIVSDYNKGFLSENDLIYVSQNHKVTFLDTKKTIR